MNKTQATHVNKAEPPEKIDLLVSIIIPVFNVREYLSEAIESVTNQSYKNLEIIIIDDGSTDGSETICDEYAAIDNRILVVHQEKQGLSAARNAGLDIMTGRVCTFLDSDDAYHESFVEIMLTEMVRSKADLILCKRTIHYTDGLLQDKKTGNIDPSISAGLYDRISALQSFAHGTINAGVWNKMYKSKLWDSVRFPVGHVYEDTATTYRILNLCGTVQVINQPLYKYRKHPKSITNTNSLNNINDWILSRHKFIGFIESNTPDIFRDEHRLFVRRSQFYGMISMYGRYSKEDDDDPNFEKDLRHRIIQIGDEFDFTKESFRMKALYQMMRCCPQVVRLIYRTYYPVRQAVLGIIEK